MKLKSILCAVGLLGCIALAEDVEDLGIVSRRRAIILDTNRTEKLLYRIEMRSLMPSSNRWELTTTNEILTLQQFTNMPAGPVLLGVRFYDSAGEESDLALYKVTVRRGPGRKPRARGIGVHDPDSPHRSMENAIEARAAAEALERALSRTNFPAPPVPGTIVPSNQETQGTNALRGLRYSPEHGTPLSARIAANPLPGVTNNASAEGIIRMQMYYERGLTERRNTR